MLKRRVVVGPLSAFLGGSQVLGCSPPFPRHRVDGTVIGTKNLKEGTRIEVLQRPLDGGGRPARTEVTGGRFLVQTNQFLDSAVSDRGKTITVVGEVAGSQQLPLDDLLYRYPVLTAKALHLWTPSRGPSFSVGIGVYHGF